MPALLGRVGLAVAWLLLLLVAARIVLGIFSAYAGAFTTDPDAHLVASQAQYLPWTAGRTVHVVEGNNGMPTHSTVWSRYGWDFGLHAGETARVGLAGIVVIARDGCAPINSHGCNSGYGNTVAVRAGDGTCARFEHLTAVTVSVGEQVRTGDPVGTVGSSGNSTGPHLHYQRENCANGHALPSSFIEAGVPDAGANLTSGMPAPARRVR